MTEFPTKSTRLKLVNGYSIIEKLGDGGMAQVYKAVDRKLDREVAIKFLRTNLEDLNISRRRFEIEVKALAKLRHPNIVSVLDFGEFEDQPYLVMEYVPGGNLKHLLGTPIPWQQTAALLAPIARALHHAHEKNTIHRDVKPSNILITEEDEPMLSDFGVAKILGSEQTTELTGTSVGIGTPYYMSPEQGRNQGVNARSDIYSLGVVFYEMLTGRKPFQADTPLAVPLKHIEDPIPNPAQIVRDLPRSVEHIIQKSLAKKPSNRFSDMSEMATALAESMNGTPRSFRHREEVNTSGRTGRDVPPANFETRRKKVNPTRQNSKTGILVTIAGLLLVAFASFYYFGNSQPAPITELADNFAFASDVLGQVEYSPPGQVNPQPVSRGDLFEAGPGATVEVVGEGKLRLEFVDNSIIFLGSDTKIELRQISNDSDAVETIIYLVRGMLLVNADIPADREFLVLANNDVVARVGGTVMGVFYDPSGRHFQVDCLEGHCVLQDSQGNETSLSDGQYAEIFGLSEISEIQPARYEFWQEIADRGLLFTPTPPPSSTATASPTATQQPGSGGDLVQPTKTEQQPEGGSTSTTKPPQDPNTPKPPTKTPKPTANQIFGCTDPDAANYDPDANKDDGSCEYP